MVVVGTTAGSTGAVHGKTHLSLGVATTAAPLPLLALASTSSLSSVGACDACSANEHAHGPLPYRLQRVRVHAARRCTHNAQAWPVRSHHRRRKRR